MSDVNENKSGELFSAVHASILEPLIPSDEPFEIRGWVHDNDDSEPVTREWWEANNPIPSSEPFYLSDYGIAVDVGGFSLETAIIFRNPTRLQARLLWKAATIASNKAREMYG